MLVNRPLLGVEAGATRAARWLIAPRELTSCAVEVHWVLDPKPCVDVGSLVHLTPPEGMTEVETAWADSFRYGTLYWRLGPDFAIVRDSRHAGVRIFILDDPESFHALQASMSGAQAQLAPERGYKDLIDERLLVKVGSQLVALPFRMRHWPVPFRAV